MQAEQELLDYLAAGGKLSSPDNAPPRYRAELLRLMAVFVDSELAGAAGFADCINLAPRLNTRIIAARIVREKYRHAGKVLALMEPFGANVDEYVGLRPWAARLARGLDLGYRRVDGDMRLNVFHYPLQGWLDAVAMNALMGHASIIQLSELADCSYQPLADVLLDILPVETRHAELGMAGLRQALTVPSERGAAQAAVDYWTPRVTATFGRPASERFEAYRRFGLRHHPNEVLLARWRERIVPLLAQLGLYVPT